MPKTIENIIHTNKVTQAVVEASDSGDRHTYAVLMDDLVEDLDLQSKHLINWSDALVDQGEQVLYVDRVLGKTI